MNLSWGRALVAAGIVAGSVGAARAQSALCVERDGRPTVVRQVRDGVPYVEEQGRLVAASGERGALMPVEEFTPVFVAVRDLTARAVETLGAGGGSFNATLEFNARFETPFLLENVFVVLELNTAEDGRVFVWREVGQLVPRVPKLLQFEAPLRGRLGAGEMQLHVFSDGGEVFHSEQPWEFREKQLDGMVSRRIRGERQAPPRPFVGPAPAYPAALLDGAVAGEAVVAVRITRAGAVVDPQVTRASAPEFGEAALAAVRLWRFLPRVKDGEPVEAKVTIPFQFRPPPREG